MYLSAHRAISVAKELMAQRIAAQRIGYIGYGEQRPIASNVTTEGQSKNRRVEIMISATTMKAAPVQEATAPQAPKKAGPVLNKDSITGGTLEQRTIITK